MKALRLDCRSKPQRPAFAPNLVLAVFGLLMLGAPACPAVAQGTLPLRSPSDKYSNEAPSNVRITPDQRTRKLTMPKGKSVIVDLPEDCAEVFVGAPTVANAVVRSPRRLYVLAVDKGPTTIFALDKDGRQIATLEINVGSDDDISQLEDIFRTALPNNDIHVHTVRDTVILTGTVDSAVEAQRAQDIATAFVGYSVLGGSGSNSGSGTNISIGGSSIVSGKLVNSITIRGKDQVMLKVMVVEIRRDIIKQLGISTSGSWGNVGGGLSGSAGNSNTVANAGTAFSGGLSSIGARSSLKATIQAYESNGVARVLAEPNVTAISGESAKFTAGGTIPIPTQGSIDPTTGICTVTYTQQPYGVTLNFTPTVLSEGRISLHLSTQVVEQDNSNQVSTTCGGGQTGFRTRQNETTVELPSGGSIVSAGLIQQTSQQTIAGTPGLMNLPILGALFRSRNYQRSESELMIVVTPYLTKTLRPEEVSKPDDGFTDATDPQSWLLGRMNRIYSTANNPALIQNYRGRVGFIND